MISIVPPGNDETIEACRRKLDININNGYHLYHTHESGMNMMMSEVKYQESLMT